MSAAPLNANPRIRFAVARGGGRRAWIRVSPAFVSPIMRSEAEPIIGPSAHRRTIDSPGVTALVAALAFAFFCLMRLSSADAAEIPKLSPGGEAAAAKPAASDSTAGRCLSRQEQRARIAARTVVPLAKAVREVRAANGRRDDILHARLCEREGRLVYLLTVLARGGKVVRVAVDAGSGIPIGAPH